MQKKLNKAEVLRINNMEIGVHNKVIIEIINVHTEVLVHMEVLDQVVLVHMEVLAQAVLVHMEDLVLMEIMVHMEALVLMEIMVHMEVLIHMENQDIMINGANNKDINLKDIHNKVDIIHNQFLNLHMNIL